MRKIAFSALLLAAVPGWSQDSTLRPLIKARPADPTWIFASPRLINANTVELIPKGVLEFNVTHNFGDIGGENGGGKTFFGLDNATDVRIGFIYGLGNKVNLVAARSKGASLVQQQYELGIKYRLLRQTKDNSHPLSLSFFGNAVVSAAKKSTFPDQDNSFRNFSDRMSYTMQMMIARRFGKISLQASPTLVARNFVVSGDQHAVFALGGALRLPVKGNFSLIMDYFHAFRSQSSIDYYHTQDIRFHDAMGIGVEFLTEGHVFHLNFTNATEILENRFIPRTVTSWGEGQFRWGFTVSRDFNFKAKKRNRK